MPEVTPPQLKGCHAQIKDISRVYGSHGDGGIGYYIHFSIAGIYWE